MTFKLTSFGDRPLDAFVFKVGAYKVSSKICDAGSGIEFAAGKGSFVEVYIASKDYLVCCRSEQLIGRFSFST